MVAPPHLGALLMLAGWLSELTSEFMQSIQAIRAKLRITSEAKTIKSPTGNAWLEFQKAVDVASESEIFNKEKKVNDFF